MQVLCALLDQLSVPGKVVVVGHNWVRSCGLVDGPDAAWQGAAAGGAISGLPRWASSQLMLLT